MPRPRQPERPPGPPRARIPDGPPSDVEEQPQNNQQPQGERPRGELEKIGALWKRRSKKGTVYLSGVCHDEKIMIFPVKEEYRTSDKSPHYTIMRSKAADEDIPF